MSVGVADTWLPVGSRSGVLSQMVSVRKRNNLKGVSLAFVCSACTASAAGWSPPPRSGPHPHRTVPSDTSANRAGDRPAAGSGQPGSGQVLTDQPGQISRVRLAGQLDSSGQLMLGQAGLTRIAGATSSAGARFAAAFSDPMFFSSAGHWPYATPANPCSCLLCAHCLDRRSSYRDPVLSLRTPGGTGEDSERTWEGPTPAS